MMYYIYIYQRLSHLMASYFFHVKSPNKVNVCRVNMRKQLIFMKVYIRDLRRRMNAFFKIHLNCLHESRTKLISISCLIISTVFLFFQGLSTASYLQSESEHAYVLSIMKDAIDNYPYIHCMNV